MFLFDSKMYYQYSFSGALAMFNILGIRNYLVGGVSG